jgi:hypothetical protein
MLRTLEYRLPGFIADVQKRLERGAEQLEGSADSECIANAASVRDLLASLVFTEDSSLSAGAQPR